MSEALEIRIARLERARRWHLLVLVGLLAAFASLALLSIKTPAEIRARKFSLVDGSGEVLAQLTDDTTYGPFLILHAKQVGADVILGSMRVDAGLGIVAQGETRVALAVGKNGTGLALSDGKGKTKLSAALTPTTFYLSDGGRPRLILEAAGLRLRDEQGKPLTTTPTTSEVSGTHK